MMWKKLIGRKKCGIIGSFFKGILFGYNEEWSVEFIFWSNFKIVGFKMNDLGSVAWYILRVTTDIYFKVT